MTLSIPISHANARLTATCDFADAGSSASRLRLYDAADNLLVTMVLTKPCGTVAAGKLTLTQQDLSGDLIVAQGTATKGVWISGAGSIVAEGTVSDETGDGDFKVGGAAGTLIYAGGRAILGLTELT